MVDVSHFGEFQGTKVPVSPTTSNKSTRAQLLLQSGSMATLCNIQTLSLMQLS